ncbi:hypothetical protein [Streptomyces sp. bgisy100]|uniref:hypothetical protein n=1 Tax=Streptomyces sp. bgisy100 TaxID=3413783 RepID=UPI003D756CF7
MSDYKEYSDRAEVKGHRKPGPGGDQGNGTSSGCMVVAPIPAILAGVAVLVLQKVLR